MLLNKALKIYDFKFAFKLLASKTVRNEITNNDPNLIGFASRKEWLLAELKSNRHIVNPYIGNVCAKLQNTELNKELKKLGLLSAPNSASIPSTNRGQVRFVSLWFW